MFPYHAYREDRTSVQEVEIKSRKRAEKYCKIEVAMI